MNILKKVTELDVAYLDTFTNRIDKEWGYLFHNVEQPAYYDANHAHIIEAPENPAAVVEEVLAFYKERSLTPRFYINNTEELGSLIEMVQSNGFRVETLAHPVQLWNKTITERMRNERITIEKVTEENFQETLEIECSIKELGGKEVREKSLPEEFKHPAFTHYLLRYDGVACSTACLFEQGDQIRLESVATIEEYRGKGLIGELIYFLQTEVKKRGFENFWVFPINERVERVYLRYGFETVANITNVHAFLYGKSIKEIQGNN